MQFRGPAEKGTYAKGCLPTEFSGKNRSGSNFSGFGNSSASRCSMNVNIMQFVPAGIVYPSAINYN